MAKLRDNTVVLGENGEAASLLAGEDVPEWAADQVGDHLLEESPKRASSKRSDS